MGKFGIPLGTPIGLSRYLCAHRCIISQKYASLEFKNCFITALECSGFRAVLILIFLADVAESPIKQRLLTRQNGSTYFTFLERNHPLHGPQVVYFYFEHVAVEFGVVARKRCNEGVAVFEQQKFFEG